MHLSVYQSIVGADLLRECADCVRLVVPVVVLHHWVVVGVTVSPRTVAIVQMIDVIWVDLDHERWMHVGQVLDSRVHLHICLWHGLDIKRHLAHAHLMRVVAVVLPVIVVVILMVLVLCVQSLLCCCHLICVCSSLKLIKII